jgi:hypothetical protein
MWWIFEFAVGHVDIQVLVRIVKEAVNTWGTSHGTFVEFVRKTQPADYKHRTRSDPNLHTLQVPSAPPPHNQGPNNILLNILLSRVT